MAKTNQAQEEEIDLGGVFKIIGKGFLYLFNAIGKFFKILFHLVITLLFFLKKNSIKIGLAIIIGAILGFFLDKTDHPKYHSELILKTNYGSGVQLYKQIDYLEDLVKKKDTITLGAALGITTLEASQLISFKIEAYQPKRNLYKLYDAYIKTTDSIFTRGIKVEDFKKRINEYDYHYHEVKVKSNLKTAFRNISLGIKNLVENEYFKNRRDIKSKELNQKLIILQKNLDQIDSLRSLYKVVALKEAEKQGPSSTLEISQRQFDNNKNDLLLFKTSDQILAQIEKINNEILNSESILNFVSDFGEIGVLDKKITSKKYFQIGLLFGGLMLLSILLLQLNSYLNNYKKAV